MPKRIAVYPGSFDPPTLGHLDLIQRAAQLFDGVIVAVAHNADKLQSLFSVEERIEMIREMVNGLQGIEVSHFTGLTVDFARKNRATAVIRGLRVMSDFEFELTMAINNHKLNPEVETVCLMSNEPHLFISSRLVKQIAALGGAIDSYVIPHVEERLREKIAKQLGTDINPAE